MKTVPVTRPEEVILEAFDFEAQCLTSGKWTAVCPRCDALAVAPTETGVVQALGDHMRVFHVTRGE